MNNLALEHLETDRERVEYLQDLLISYSTSGGGDDNEYKFLRDLFLRNPVLKDLLPDYIRTRRSLSEFWSFIKNKFAHYNERREFIWESFNPALTYLEQQGNTFPKETIGKALKNFNEEVIHREWEKALLRVSNDPEGAITSARALLESVCKFILDERKVAFNSEMADLNDLYKATARELNLSVDQHHEGIFKQILGGCSGIVSGLGTLRNKLGDAHGANKAKVRPRERHAELAVNLAGSMTLFLIRTHLENNILTTKTHLK